MTWRRILILDSMLAALMVVGVFRVRHSWDEFEGTHRVQAVQAETEPARTVPGATTVAVVAEDWTDISIKNPFSFDRNDVPIVAPKQEVPTSPKPVLLGTMSVGNQWIAMLAPGQSGGRSSRPVKVGETMGDWRVVEINDKSVVVTAESGVRATIVMNDPTAQVARDYIRTGTSGSTAPVIVTPSTPAAPPTTTSTSSSVPAAQPTQPGAAQPADDILLTPFGPVKRTRP
jgi:hypothetical protein